MSWRNPDERHRGWGLDTYAAARSRRSRRSARSPAPSACHLAGNCSGGALVSPRGAHLAERGELDASAGIMLGVCVIDSRARRHGQRVHEPRDRRGQSRRRRKGYLDGARCRAFFAWLRPNDLIWSYVVNNYLLGKQPPAFDILFWNADTTNMAAGLHATWPTGAHQRAGRTGAMELLGTPIDLGRVTVDAYVVGRHLRPHHAVGELLRARRSCSAATRASCSTSGHVAALVNPPGNPKATYRTGDGRTRPCRGVARGRPHAPGHLVGRLGRRAGGALGPAPRGRSSLGDKTYPAAEPAPGTYVFH